jgi:probable phosphoglycerate mutase
VTEVWIVRHGQTEWNTEKRLQGRRDSPLTALGRQQALDTGRALASQPFSSAWCSPAYRALHTAQLINSSRSQPLQFHQSEALSEMYFGEWEGHTRAEIESRWGERSRHFWVAPHRWEPFGGESFAQAERRITQFLAQVDQADGPVLVVSHGMMVQLLLHAIRGKALEHLYESPFVLQASVTRVLIDPRRTPAEWEILAAGAIVT